MVEVVYKPRKPKTSPLYQSISEHFSEFESVYEERYQNKYGVLRDAQYILRSPFSLEKMTYQQQSKTVLYRSKMNPVLKKNFAVFPVLDWIATLTTHIPNKGEQLIRYYSSTRLA